MINDKWQINANNETTSSHADDMSRPVVTTWSRDVLHTHNLQQSRWLGDCNQLIGISWFAFQRVYTLHKLNTLNFCWMWLLKPAKLEWTQRKLSQVVGTCVALVSDPRPTKAQLITNTNRHRSNLDYTNNLSQIIWQGYLRRNKWQQWQQLWWPKLEHTGARSNSCSDATRRQVDRPEWLSGADLVVEWQWPVVVG